MAPIATITVGAPLPSAERIAYEAHKRWHDSFYPTLVVRGTVKLHTFYGGEPRNIVAAHLSHQLALTDVFLQKRAINPHFEWEILSCKPGEVRADAVSMGVMIELVGQYSGSVVAAKLEISVRSNLELW